MSIESVDPRTLAGDPIAHRADQAHLSRAQLLEAAENVLDWLDDRRAHMPPEILDPREARHRKALRDAVRGAEKA